MQLFMCIHICSRSFKRSFHVHRLSINLLVKFTSKTDEWNTTKNKFIPYLCFIVVDFIHCCHHSLKMSSSSLKKKKFSVNQSDLLVIDTTTAFMILKSLETEFLKRFLVKGRQQSFWKFSILSNILDLEWCLSNKWKLHSATVCHVYQCSPEAPAAGVFTSYLHFKCWLLLLDKIKENDSRICFCKTILSVAWVCALNFKLKRANTLLFLKETINNYSYLVL